MTGFVLSTDLSPRLFERHAHFMRDCISLAKVSVENGESAVGAVLVKDDQIIARGTEGVKQNNDFTFHAEIVCIRNAGKVLNSRHLGGCTLYTTHEPCIMCSYVIRQSAIARVVIGTLSGEKGGLVSPFPLLTDRSIKSWTVAPEVITAVLEAECLKLK